MKNDSYFICLDFFNIQLLISTFLSILTRSFCSSQTDRQDIRFAHQGCCSGGISFSSYSNSRLGLVIALVTLFSSNLSVIFFSSSKFFKNSSLELVGVSKIEGSLLSFLLVLRIYSAFLFILGDIK